MSYCGFTWHPEPPRDANLLTQLDEKLLQFQNQEMVVTGIVLRFNLKPFWDAAIADRNSQIYETSENKYRNIPVYFAFQLVEDCRIYTDIAELERFRASSNCINPAPGSLPRCCWNVSAGYSVGVTANEHTRQWIMTNQEYAEADSIELFASRMMEATNYMHQLHNPYRFNWVRMDWIWF